MVNPELMPVKGLLRGVGGIGLAKIFGFFFTTIFIIIPILYAITISIQSGNIQSGVSYIAPKLITPVQTLNQQSLLAIHQNGVYVSTGNFLKDIFNFLKYYWLLLGSMYIIYRWIKTLYKLMPLSPFSNNSSAKMTNLFLAVFIFIFVQMLFLGYTATINPDLSYWTAINLPFRAVLSLLSAFPYLIDRANSIINFGDNSTMINITSNISNATHTLINHTTNNISSNFIIYK